MKKTKLFSKIIPIILIVSILFTACDVPDISKFTEQSAEMTRGIRQGIKETDTILLDASKRNNLFDPGQLERITKQLTEYRKNTKTTVKVMESIDSYLEALNALAQANKKSGETSKAVVDSVSGLVAAASGITIADGAIKLATGIGTLLEKFRTAKAFKERVELVDQIMNGGDATGNKPCTQDPRGVLTNKVRGEIDLLDNQVKQKRIKFEAELSEQITILDDEIKKLTEQKDDAEKAENEAADPKVKDKQKFIKEQRAAQIDEKIEAKEAKKAESDNKISELYAKRIADLTQSQKDAIEKAVEGVQCGVIDLLRFNIEDLQVIYNSVALTLHTRTKIKNRTVLDYHDSIVVEDGRVQKTLLQILGYKSRNVEYNRLVRAQQKTEDIKIAMKDDLTGIFMTDLGLEDGICAIVKCVGEKKLIDEADFVSNFDTYRSKIFVALGPREVELLDLNKRYTADLQRIDPAYSAVNAELKQIKTKQKQMNDLFKTSGEALDTWGQTHSNLRLSFNTKRPLTVSRLVSKVKEIWSILNPETTESNK
jgi:hypothetical protein